MVGVGSNTQKLVFKYNTKYMSISPNTFWGDGIWYFKYQILFEYNYHTKFTFSNYRSIQSWFFCYIKLKKTQMPLLNHNTASGSVIFILQT